MGKSPLHFPSLHVSPPLSLHVSPGGETSPLQWRGDVSPLEGRRSLHVTPPLPHMSPLHFHTVSPPLPFPTRLPSTSPGVSPPLPLEGTRLGTSLPYSGGETSREGKYFPTCLPSTSLPYVSPLHFPTCLPSTSPHVSPPFPQTWRGDVCGSGHVLPFHVYKWRGDFPTCLPSTSTHVSPPLPHKSPLHFPSLQVSPPLLHMSPLHFHTRLPSTSTHVSPPLPFPT